jgi:hypothetical protein
MGCPCGAGSCCPVRFPMSIPASVGVELQPPGVDARWVCIWMLDAEALHCHLAILGRGACLSRVSLRACLLAIHAGPATSTFV